MVLTIHLVFMTNLYTYRYISFCMFFVQYTVFDTFYYSYYKYHSPIAENCVLKCQKIDELFKSLFYNLNADVICVKFMFSSAEYHYMGPMCNGDKKDF